MAATRDIIKCDACGGVTKGKFNSCGTCNFDVCSSCMPKRKSLHSEHDKWDGPASAREKRSAPPKTPPPAVREKVLEMHQQRNSPPQKTQKVDPVFPFPADRLATASSSAASTACISDTSGGPT